MQLCRGHPGGCNLRGMNRFRLLLMVMVTLCFAGELGAKEWDPRLSRSMELSFAGTPEQAEPLIRNYRRENPRDPTGIIFWTLIQEWSAGMGPGNHEEIYPQNQKLLEEAVAMAEQNYRANPDHVDALIDLGNAYFFLARNLAEQGSFFKSGLTGKKVETPMRKALEKDPGRREAYLALGAYHYFAGNTPKFWIPIKALFGIRGNKEQGLKELQEALLGRHPFLWQARFALLEIYTYQEKEPSQALKYLKPFEERFPQNPLVPMKRAQILELENPLMAAAVLLDLAKECGEKFRPCPQKFPFYAFSQAGQLYLKEGIPSTAWVLLGKALEVDPRNYPKRTRDIGKLRKKSLQAMKKVQAESPL